MSLRERHQQPDEEISNVEILKIDPTNHPETIEAIALAYQLSFGGEPWNEGYICPVCKKVFALFPKIETCPSCMEQSRTILLEERWPVAQVISNFNDEMKEPEAICVVAELNQRVIGFAWGYRVSSNPTLDEHLEAPGLHEQLEGDFFYLDECALVPVFQGKGLGKLIVKCIFRERLQNRIILRTKNNSPMCNLIKKLGGEIIQHVSDDRVIMKLFNF